MFSWLGAKLGWRRREQSESIWDETTIRRLGETRARLLAASQSIADEFPLEDNAPDMCKKRRIGRQFLAATSALGEFYPFLHPDHRDRWYLLMRQFSLMTQLALTDSALWTVQLHTAGLFLAWANALALDPRARRTRMAKEYEAELRAAVSPPGPTS